MSELPERPARRPVEVKEVALEGRPAYWLKDPLRLSDEMVVLPLVGVAVWELMDGQRTLREVAEEFEKRHGFEVPLEQVRGLARALEQACLFRGGRAQGAVAEWLALPVREPACAGPNGSYPSDPSELRKFLDAHWTREGGPGEPPDGASKKRPIRGVLSPHIDFHRGGHAYAWAWKAVAEACEAELFVVFGTAHAGTDTARFALTKKTYDTPLGPVATDVELVEKLAASYEGEDDLFAGEFAHKGEHSIEFQMVELAHLFGKGSPRERKIRALPVLCGGLHDLMEGPARPGEDARVRSFHDALAKALDGIPPERVCFVGGVDLAHVGKDFDQPKVGTKKLAKYMEKDLETLELVTKKQDADAFHADVCLDPSRNICGHSPIHATLEALARLGRKHEGELLKHDRWYDGESSVSFCSVVFRDGKKKR